MPFFSLFFFFLLGFKKSAEFDTTRPICNRLGANRVDIDTRYEIMSGSVKTRWTWPSSRDDLVDSLKIQRIESPRYEEPKNQKKKISNFQRFL